MALLWHWAVGVSLPYTANTTAGGSKHSTSPPRPRQTPAGDCAHFTRPGCVAQL
ncbi:hypothetical protein QEG98_06370 [Myxococcus sp. MxC21-1]|nr:hypothetical protein QEG98_06370 [Myxococcus sp. MxC21-1]